ncbi:hybrid sensor histidine kinase/response regulator, partial [Pseudomonas aeruginosa]
QDNVHLGGSSRDRGRRNAQAAPWAGLDLRLRPCRLWTPTDRGLLPTRGENLLSVSRSSAGERPPLIGVRRRT